MEIHTLVDGVSVLMIEARRYIHRHPELAGSEHGTAKYIFDKLEAASLHPALELHGTAVICRVHGVAEPAHGGQRRTILVRADIDALPLTEADDGRTCRSEVDGAMHACGHDAHAAILVGVASVLGAHPEILSGDAILVFQPAEERNSGASEILSAGLLEGDTIDGVLGLHVLSQLDLGLIGLRNGALFASIDEFHIEVIGRAGHGGLPQFAIDPLPAVAALVSQIQSLVTRELSPLDSAVISVGHVSGGTVPNAIIDRIVLDGTIRAFSSDAREKLVRRLREITKLTCESYGSEGRFTVVSECPAVVCDARMVDVVAKASIATKGATPAHVSPLSASDDFAKFLSLAPGCYFMLGARIPGGTLRRHHHPEFELDERCLPIGAEVFLRSMIRFCDFGWEIAGAAANPGGDTSAQWKLDSSGADEVQLN